MARYSCNFGFEQKVTDSKWLPLSDTVFGAPDCSTSDPCFIAAGSNEVGQINVTVGSVSPSEVDQPSYLGTETGISWKGIGDDPTSTGGDPTDLAQIASRTNTAGDGGLTYSNVFEHFPSFAENPDNVRDPFDVWDAEYS